MIRVRDDDFIVQSSVYRDIMGKVRQIHGLICDVPKMIHVPTILVTDIKEFPECIDWIRGETAEGRMEPEIHGLHHKDYAALTSEEIVLELEECQEFISNEFNWTPTKFYSPWGAGEDERGAHVRPAAASVGIELVTCAGAIYLNGRNGVVKQLRDGRSLDYLDGCEMFTHWWARDERLKLIVEVSKHGSWDEAEKHNKELFRENGRFENKEFY